MCSLDVHLTWNSNYLSIVAHHCLVHMQIRETITARLICVYLICMKSHILWFMCVILDASNQRKLIHLKLVAGVVLSQIHLI